jgi:hypothetical protein
MLQQNLLGVRLLEGREMGTESSSDVLTLHMYSNQLCWLVRKYPHASGSE